MVQWPRFELQLQIYHHITIVRSSCYEPATKYSNMSLIHYYHLWIIWGCHFTISFVLKTRWNWIFLFLTRQREKFESLCKLSVSFLYARSCLLYCLLGMRLRTQSQFVLISYNHLCSCSAINCIFVTYLGMLKHAHYWVWRCFISPQFLWVHFLLCILLLLQVTLLWIWKKRLL